jgi:hypothetical protein
MDCLEWKKSLVIISIIASLALSSALFAEPVDLPQVQKVTDAFLRTRTPQPGVGAKTPGITVQGVAVVTSGGFREIRDDDGTVLAYVADLEPRGFVALSADTDIAPVIAYSFRSPFPSTQDKKNPLFRMVREDMRLRAKSLAEHPELRTSQAGGLWDLDAHRQTSLSAAAFQQWPPEGSTSTGGWLETAWDQDVPYNKFCPLDSVDRKRSYTGCMATALAQVLHYYRRANFVFGPNDVYVTYGGMQIDADSKLYDFPSFAELNGYVAAVNAKYSAGTSLNDVDVAALNFACGVAMHMDYSSEGSGAAPAAMLSTIVGRLGFTTADMFGGLSPESHLVLQENVMNRLPALVTIGPADGFGGHIVICDGYNTEGEYHLNFGWGADSPEKIADVWYRLPTDFYAHELVVTETFLNVQPVEPAIAADPVSLSFYGMPGQESDVQVLRIRTSVGSVQVNSILSPEGFVVAMPDEFSDRLPSFAIPRPKQAVSILVKFLPQREGGYYGPLAIHYDDGKTKYVILKGWSFNGGTQIAAGDVSGTWSRDKSPYFVTGDVNVPASGELVIEPGVKVFFVGPYGLTVGENARLTAQGNAVQPIELTAWNKDAGWAGLRFIRSGTDDVLSYCSISYAKKGAALIPRFKAASGNAEEDNVGGAIYCYVSSPTVESCKITNNLGDHGGAIYCKGSFPTVNNTLIANNTSLSETPRCGGVCCDQSGAIRLRNCTIVNNSPGGIFAASWDGMQVTNTIVWGNDMYQIQTDESWPTVTFCDVQGGWAGAGNMDVDPSFLRPSTGMGIEYDGSAANWALKSDSPCINAGTQIKNFPATDLAGGPRVYSNVTDVGAYENQSDLPLMTVAPSLTADAGFTQLNASSTIQLTLANTGKQEFKIESAAVVGANTIFSILTPVDNIILPPGGSIPVKVGFTPTREKTYTASLDIRSTAGNASRLQVALKGVGITGTVVPPGPVSGTWKKASSPYVVTGDIAIPRSETLRIEAGVTVKFAGHFRMTVGYRATLTAMGTKQDPITFTATNKGEGWYGMRFVNSGSEDMLYHCTIEYARKPRSGGDTGFYDLFGGAILCCISEESGWGYPTPSSPTIDSCLIAHNSGRTGGAIMFADSSEAILTNNTLVDNAADYDGGAIAVYFAFCEISNNVIARNYALVGGGIYNYLGYPVIANNTFAYNRPGALFLETARYYPEDTTTVPIINNIIWGNEIYLSAETEPDEYDIRYNDVQGGWAGDGNIDKDPLFANPDAGDYHLKSQGGRWDPKTQAWVLDKVTSPCIDAGDPMSAFAQEPAPNGQRVNMGAYGGTDQASKSPGP